MNKKQRSRGLSGFGVLIILIAMILVGSVASVIIMSTSSRLRSRSLTTSQQIENAMATGVEIVSIMGTDGSQGKDIEHFEVIMKLAAGSGPLNLNDTMIFLNTKRYTQSIYYNSSTGDTKSNAATTSDYTVEWVRNGSTNQIEGYLNEGDLIRMRFNYYESGPTDNTGGIGENEDVDIRIVPRIGQPTLITFKTPEPIREERQPLWPADSLL